MPREEIFRKLRGESTTLDECKIKKKKKPVEEGSVAGGWVQENVEETGGIDEMPDLGRMEPGDVMKMLRKKVGDKERRGKKEVEKVGIEKRTKKKPEEKERISKKDKLNKILLRMELKTSGIQGSAIVTRDGLIVASRLPSNVDLNAFGGFSASFFGATETTIYELKKVRLYDVYIESDEGKLIAVEGGEYAFLVTLVKLDANTGLILMHMKKAARDIRQVMES